MLFCSQQNVKNLPHEFIFVFILDFIGTIMTTYGSSSIYSCNKADFRVSGLKRSQPYLTMYIPIVIFSFLDTSEHSKNQLSLLFILEIQQIIDFKGHTYIWRYLLIIIKVTFSFCKYILTYKKWARLIHSYRD